MFKRLKTDFKAYLKILVSVTLAIVLVMFSGAAAAPALAEKCAVNDNDTYNLSIVDGKTYGQGLYQLWQVVTKAYAAGGGKPRITNGAQPNTCFIVAVTSSELKGASVNFYIRRENLYVTGFQPVAAQEGEQAPVYVLKGASVPDVPETVDLAIGESYSDLYPSAWDGNAITRGSIIEWTKVLLEPNLQNQNALRRGIAGGAFYISEALRFKPVAGAFKWVFTQEGNAITFKSALYPYVNEWGKCTQAYTQGGPGKSTDTARAILLTAKVGLQADENADKNCMKGIWEKP